MTKAQMTKEIQNSKDEDDQGNSFVLHEGGAPREFNLEERTAKFGEAVIQFCKKISTGPITTPLVSQLVRSATSVGANYCEADNAVSTKEFRLKIATSQKEARETKHWLRMIVAAVPEQKGPTRLLWHEARELHLIFSAILRKTRTE